MTALRPSPERSPTLGTTPIEFLREPRLSVADIQPGGRPWRTLEGTRRRRRSSPLHDHSCVDLAPGVPNPHAPLALHPGGSVPGRPPRGERPVPLVCGRRIPPSTPGPRWDLMGSHGSPIHRTESDGKIKHDSQKNPPDPPLVAVGVRGPISWQCGRLRTGRIRRTCEKSTARRATDGDVRSGHGPGRGLIRPLRAVVPRNSHQRRPPRRGQRSQPRSSSVGSSPGSSIGGGIRGPD